MGFFVRGVHLHMTELGLLFVLAPMRGMLDHFKALVKATSNLAAHPISIMLASKHKPLRAD